MGKKSTPKAPPAPDYAALAQQQGDANVKASQVDAELTNTNQYTPYGSQVFTKSPDSNQWSSTITLSPDQQRLYDLQNQGDQALGETAVSQLDRVKQSMSQPLDLSGAPDRVNSVAPSNYSMYSGSTPTYGQVQNNTNYSTLGAGPQYGTVGSGPDMSRLGSGPDYSKYTDAIANLPDYGQQAQQVEDSIYHQATSQLDPQYAQLENSERQRLLNAGVAEGSEAYNNAMDSFTRSKTAAYGDARDRAIQARGAEQSRLNNDFYTGNQQKFNQTLQSLGFNNDTSARQFADSQTAAGFNNDASQQEFANRLASTNQGNAAAQQGYADAATRAGFNNSTQAQQLSDALRTTDFNNTAQSSQFNDALKALGFNNTAEAQKYADAISGGNFQNTQRGAAIDEAAYLRNDPLNMYNALSSGAQVTNPTFRGTGQVQGPAAAPVFAAGQAQDQRAIDLYNAQLAQSGSASSGLFGALGSLGGAALGNWGSIFGGGK